MMNNIFLFQPELQKQTDKQKNKQMGRKNKKSNICSALQVAALFFLQFEFATMQEQLAQNFTVFSHKK